MSDINKSLLTQLSKITSALHETNNKKSATKKSTAAVVINKISSTPLPVAKYSKIKPAATAKSNVKKLTFKRVGNKQDATTNDKKSTSPPASVKKQSKPTVIKKQSKTDDLKKAKRQQERLKKSDLQQQQSIERQRRIKNKHITKSSAASPIVDKDEIMRVEKNMIKNYANEKQNERVDNLMRNIVDSVVYDNFTQNYPGYGAYSYRFEQPLRLPTSASTSNANEYINTDYRQVLPPMRRTFTSHRRVVI